MAVPNKPVAGAPIESAWGSIAHDTAVAMDIQAGTVVCSVNNATSGTVAVTFARPFASPPTVVDCQASGSLITYATVATVTTTGCTLALVSRSGNAVTVNHGIAWIAYGPRA